MARFADLKPKWDNSIRRWYVSTPARLSATGKRQRKFFKDKQDATEYGKSLSDMEQRNALLVKKVTPEVVEIAAHYHELFQLYGFGGLKEACERLEKDLIAENNSYRFRDLAKAFKKEHFSDWSKRHQDGWDTLERLLSPMLPQLLVALTTAQWRSFFSDLSEQRSWSPRSYNFYVGRVATIYSWGVNNGFCEEDPTLGITRRKKKKSSVSILTPKQTKLLLDTAWEHDRDMVPYFAIGIFAGLRPDCELEPLQWEDVNFEEGWIRVHFGNKTDTKRFVPIEDNLMAWLEPWKKAKGAVCPSNLTKRRRYVVRGKYQSPQGTPENKWKPIASWKQRDIMRHSYGSYLDAQYQDRNMIKANMGHTDFKTYEQHYRRAVTPKQGGEFWSIMPPLTLPNAA